ncbi:MAG: hypothetical protein ACXADU_19060 [Promethearchaeota archaeon]|jgi:hypothetical protein
MVYVVITAWWPLDKQQDVSNAYNKQLQDQPTPDYIKSAQMWLKPCKKGWKSVTYNEVEQGKLEEGLLYLATFMNAFISIKGYGYKFDLMVSQQEALAGQQG